MGYRLLSNHSLYRLTHLLASYPLRRIVLFYIRCIRPSSPRVAGGLKVEARRTPQPLAAAPSSAPTPGARPCAPDVAATDLPRPIAVRPQPRPDRLPSSSFDRLLPPSTLLIRHHPPLELEPRLAPPALEYARPAPSASASVPAGHESPRGDESPLLHGDSNSKGGTFEHYCTIPRVAPSPLSGGSISKGGTFEHCCTISKGGNNVAGKPVDTFGFWIEF